MLVERETLLTTLATGVVTMLNARLIARATDGTGVVRIAAVLVVCRATVATGVEVMLRVLRNWRAAVMAATGVVRPTSPCRSAGRWRRPRWS
jgi:hypothetical protein